MIDVEKKITNQPAETPPPEPAPGPACGVCRWWRPKGTWNSLRPMGQCRFLPTPVVTEVDYECSKFEAKET